VRQLRAAIVTRLERGDTLQTVERELIVPSGLPDEQQSALWVYAWSHPNRPPAAAPRLSVWAALGNALLTLIGIYRYSSRPVPPRRVQHSLSTNSKSEAPQENPEGASTPNGGDGLDGRD
jgi:hypothetical protein